MARGKGWLGLGGFRQCPISLTRVYSYTLPWRFWPSDRPDAGRIYIWLAPHHDPILDSRPGKGRPSYVQLLCSMTARFDWLNSCSIYACVARLAKSWQKADAGP